jgi:hypothetical protein
LTSRKLRLTGDILNKISKEKGDKGESVQGV